MKRKYLFIASFLLLIIPISVKAENKIYFESNKISAMPGGTYSVNIKVDSDTPFSSVSFDVITTSNFVNLSKVVINDAFTNVSDDYSYSLTTKRPQASGTIVATVSFKIDSDISLGEIGVIKIVDPSLTINKNYSLDASKLTLKVNKKKSNDLGSLSSAVAPIKFNSETLSYEVKVKENVEKFDLVAVPEDPKAKVIISNQELKLRKNIITVRVTREGLNDKAYRVVVLKDVKEDNSLKIQKNKENDKKEASIIKRRWFPIIIGLFIVLLVDLFFVKGSKN